MGNKSSAYTDIINETTTTTLLKNYINHANTVKITQEVDIDSKKGNINIGNIELNEKAKIGVVSVTNISNGTEQIMKMSESIAKKLKQTSAGLLANRTVDSLTKTIHNKFTDKVDVQNITKDINKALSIQRVKLTTDDGNVTVHNITIDAGSEIIKTIISSTVNKSGFSESLKSVLNLVTEQSSKGISAVIGDVITTLGKYINSIITTGMKALSLSYGATVLAILVGILGFFMFIYYMSSSGRPVVYAGMPPANRFMAGSL